MKKIIIALALLSSFIAPAIAQIEILTQNRTYFVSSSGNDNNDCLADNNTCATLQGAYDKIANNIDLNNYDVEIQYVGSGTLTPASGIDGLRVTRPWRGGGNVTVSGDTGNPANVTIQTSGGAHCIRVDGVLTGTFTVRGFTLNCPGGYGVRNGSRGDVAFGYIIFGPAYHHVGTEKRESYIRSIGPYSINGNADRHLDCDAGFIYIRDKVTITGSRTFSTFARARNAGYLLTEPNIWIVQNSVVGERYQVYENATISTQGGGQNHYPGNAAGNPYPQYNVPYLE